MFTDLMKREMKCMDYVIDVVLEGIEMIIGLIDEDNASCISILTGISKDRIVGISKHELNCTYEEFANLNECLLVLEHVNRYIGRHPRRDRM